VNGNDPLPGLTLAQWRQRVPDLMSECRRAWDLELGEPYPAGVGGYVAPAQRRDGSAVVFKLIYPHRESRHEADALARWDGAGAVRLLARDDERFAMLLERCEPGTPLASIGDHEALAVFVDLLPRLWVPAGPPFRTLADESAWWVSYADERWEQFGRPFERRLLDAAIEILAALPPTQGEQVLLHQDLHDENVLAAERESWLAIDPKPLVGEREFGVAPIIRASELEHSRAAVLRRFDHLTAELGLDRGRARGWTIAQTIAWSFDPDYVDGLADIARWLDESSD
jgi:streptomycin 6-kinase